MRTRHRRSTVVGLCTLALSAWAAAAFPQATFTGQGLVYAAHAGGNAVAVDGSGSAYLAESAPAPDVTYPSGAYVTKLDAEGRNVVYRAYLGHGTPTSIAVDGSGNAYIAGYANKGDFPATDAHITPGTNSAAFIVKLDPDGTIAYSVLVGGIRSIATGVAVDAAGNAYVTGDALGDGFPTTEGAFQTAWHTGPGFGDIASDVFVFKVSSAGALLYSTLLGGNDYDAAGGIAVDAAGNAYVTGRTGGGFPVTAGVFQPTPGSTWTHVDAFVTKLNATGSALIYSTYLGGTGSDAGDAIALDSSANAYVVGATDSLDFPTTPGAAQTSYGSITVEPSVYDAFVAKLSASGDTLMYGTYLGGPSNDDAASVAVDAEGHALVVGSTASAEFPVTARAFQTAAQGGRDAFVTRLDDAGAILYSTRLGGTASDAARGIAVDRTGDVYVTGGGSPADFPYTAGTATTVPIETSLAFAAKLIPRATLVQAAASSSAESPALNAGAAIDGNPATRWSSQFSDLQWIAVDLGSRTAIDRVVLQWETAYATVYALEVSDDGIAWTTAYTTAAGDGGVDDIPLTTTARYVRMAGGMRATAWGFSLWEFAVFGTAASANLLPSVTITSPANATVLTAPVTFPIDVTAADADGSVARVDVIVNGQLAGTDMTAPFSLSTTLTAPGTYSLRAEAFDDMGASASAAIAIEVVAGPAPGTNLALGRPVVSSSNETPALGPANAVDGNTGTRWSSAFSDNEWIYVDLGQRYRIGTVVLNWEAAYASSFELQVSDDAINWSTVYWSPYGQTGGDQIITALIGTGRFVRMWGGLRATPWGFSLWEMEVYGTLVEEPLPPNVAVGKPATASSVESAGLGPEAVNDGLVNTRWSSAFADDQWISVDLGVNYNINRVILRWETAYASHYLLQVSNDATTWTTVRDVTSAGGVDDFADLAAAGRYVRMYGVTRATQWGFSLWEFEVYGTPTGDGLTNVAAGKMAFSSSDESPQLAPEFVNDGTVSTRWASQWQDNQWIYVDLGALYDVNRVVLRWETAFASHYLLQLSNDATSWRTVRDVASDGGVDELDQGIGTARYVRMYGLTRATEWGFSLREFEVYGTPAVFSPDIALDANATASSEESAGLAAANASDGELATRWSSAFNDGEWLMLDFGRPVYLNRLVLHWETAYAQNYTIQSSHDGTTWEDAMVVVGSDGGVDDLSVDVTHSRYVRVLCVQRATEWGSSLWEVEAYEPLAQP